MDSGARKPGGRHFEILMERAVTVKYGAVTGKAGPSWERAKALL